MSDVRQVYITREVAVKLNLSTSYLIKLAKKLNLGPDEMRDAGSRNYLFNQKAIEKIKKARDK